MHVSCADCSTDILDATKNIVGIREIEILSHQIVPTIRHAELPLDLVEHHSTMTFFQDIVQIGYNGGDPNETQPDGAPVEGETEEYSPRIFSHAMSYDFDTYSVSVNNAHGKKTL